MTDDPQLERYYALKMRIQEMAQEMGLDMDHYSILMETDDPKLALVFTVEPDAFTIADDTVQVETNSMFEDMISNMLNPEPEIPEIPTDVAVQIKDFLDG